MSSSVSGSIREVFESRYFPAGCFAIFLTLRLLIAQVPVEPTSDFGWYFNRASDLLAGNGYSEGGSPTAFWPIGYPAFLAAAMATFGKTVVAGQIANLILASASFWLTFMLAKVMFGDHRVARVAILLLAIYPNNAAYVALLASEVLFTFLLISAVWVLSTNRGWSTVVVTGVIFGLAMIVKSQVLLIIVPITMLMLSKSFAIKDLLGVMVRSMLILLIAIVCVLPWTARNLNVMGAPVLVSTNGGVSLLCGNNPSVIGNYRLDFDCEDPLFENVKFSVQDQIAADARARAIAWKWISENPTSFVGMFPKKFFRLWALDGEAEWSWQAGSSVYKDNVTLFRATRVLNQLFYVFVLLAAAVGMWLTFKGAFKPSAYVGMAIALILTAISLVFSGQSRYHFPAMPFLMMYASLTLVVGMRRYYKRGG